MRRPTAKNIVLIVLDSVRADHLGCLGYARDTAPTMAALARNGVLWESAWSASSWTKPSVATMLTGLFPSQHGVLKGPKRTRDRPVTKTDALAADLPHVAAQFSAHGFRCGAFLNNVQLERYTGFDRGFETYLPVCGKADLQIQEFDHWLDASDSRPFFAYFHFMETHWPYKPRRRHVELFGGSRDSSRFDGVSALEMARLRRGLKLGTESLDQTDRDDLVRMYDASIRRLDGKIRDIQMLLDRSHFAKDTCLVITADHGEEFLEHGSIGHGRSLHAEVTHVPLLIYRPDDKTSHRRREPVSLVDLPKTLLSIAGIDAPFPGQSLLDDDPNSPAYCELSAGRSFHRTVIYRQWRLHRKSWSGDEDRNSTELARRVCSDEVKGSDTTMLYDLSCDPMEQVDLSTRTDLGWVIESADSILDQIQTSERISDDSVEVDEVVVARLRDLGYID